MRERWQRRSDKPANPYWALAGTRSRSFQESYAKLQRTMKEIEAATEFAQPKRRVQRDYQRGSISPLGGQCPDRRWSK